MFEYKKVLESDPVAVKFPNFVVKISGDPGETDGLKLLRKGRNYNGITSPGASASTGARAGARASGL